MKVYHVKGVGYFAHENNAIKAADNFKKEVKTITLQDHQYSFRREAKIESCLRALVHLLEINMLPNYYNDEALFAKEYLVTRRRKKDEW